MRFATVFVALGASASAIGAVLRAYCAKSPPARIRPGQWRPNNTTSPSRHLANWCNNTQQFGFKGDKQADLPVQQSIKVELVPGT